MRKTGSCMYAEKAGAVPGIGRSRLCLTGSYGTECLSSGNRKQKENEQMQLYDELVARGLIAQVTNED